ncbi:alkaline shock response membrane anchor protein AmaP [Desulfofundulus sp. TPOSR]|uniref:alkaline shock response membrane anchor protein AmaP n=1 Tax=Desulfofundulus sp. TPOSR TaxID=2714340 RepID=UPI0014072947|nr:alkaline shock response membrane anchor protein AmaP [Desulfofundulus sp. TPOSR]NHM27834.1 alkaline shock response membrane anchor protein AmaP [Desulfofundulus sp. TPOSR]
MGPFDRGLLVIYTFIVTVALVWAAAAVAGFIPPYRVWGGLNMVIGQPQAVIALLGLFILGGARLFWVGVRPRRRQAVVHEAALGQVRIALTAIQDLVEKVALAQNGVREAGARVYPGKEGIRIGIRVAVTPDINIPATAAMVQEQVKNRVLEVTGVTVQDVAITVKSISARKPRVE